MLITRSGFNAFNEYDLSATLEAQLSRLKDDVKVAINSGRTEEIAALAEKHKLTPLAFDTQNLTVSTSTAMIPAEYFPNNFFVDAGKKYQKDILVFHLPFIGDPSLLHCVPSTRILWTEKIDSEGNDVIFEIIKFNDDVDEIRKERDKVVNFLNQQGANINKQIDQYNEAIKNVVAETEIQTRSQISKNEEFLSQLGTPIKQESAPPPTTSIKKRPSRLTEKKTETFDVFICHANEDKGFVDQLAKALKNDGITVWYDSFQIGWGDDLRPTIDDGLKNSRYGIVVFSAAFLKKKKWTEYELNGLFSKEKNGQKVILPIWHNIMRDDISEYSQSFADRIAKSSQDISSIVKELKDLLTPETTKKK